ncbi:MAG: DUF3017 domain-containing protein [Kutzneria sp.]|nr:DUF3017 domain-containing protein [Kutzneria sp.]MBV9843885.1 DUF3017 domain-containing protein [Kutzneria sp.]
MKGGVPSVSEPRRRRLSTNHLPFALVLLVVAVGFERILAYHWREGTALIGVALLLASALRQFLGSRPVGLIAIRGKLTDVVLYGVLGLLILAVALTITPGGPFDTGR